MIIDGVADRIACGASKDGFQVVVDSHEIGCVEREKEGGE